MSAISVLFDTIAVGLKLWASHEANKYRDELAAIKKEYYAEKSKAEPNMALLDNLEFRLFVLGSTFASRASETQGPSLSISHGQSGTLL